MSRLVAAGYAAAWAGTRWLPDRVAAAAFRDGADLAVRLGTAGTGRLRANLARVAPHADLDALVLAGTRSYARYWRELFAAPGMDLARVTQRFELGVHGREHLDAAVRHGRGVVLALPHAGNWDLAGAWLAARYGRCAAVAERLQPESLYRRFVAARAKLGIDVVTGVRELYERLRAGGLVCLIADRLVAGDGAEVEFFGARARFPTGPARLAAATGAALLPASCWFTEHGWGARVHPPLDRGDPVAATAALAARFAEEIGARPQDWHMFADPWCDAR